MNVLACARISAEDPCGESVMLVSVRQRKDILFLWHKPEADAWGRAPPNPMEAAVCICAVTCFPVSWRMLLTPGWGEDRVRPHSVRGPLDMALRRNIGGLPAKLLLDPWQGWEWNIAVGGLVVCVCVCVMQQAKIALMRLESGRAMRRESQRTAQVGLQWRH